jgi:hypothetical protein
LSKEIAADSAIIFNGTWRRDRNLIDDVNITTQPSDYTVVPYPDPGPDGRPGTADDRALPVFNQSVGLGRPNLLQVTNPDGAEREYKSLEAIVVKRMSNRWQGMLSMVWQSAAGNVQTNRADASGNSSAYNDPNSTINMYGPTVLDANWQAKLMATYVAPFDISLSGYYLQQSGAPMYRTLSIQLAQGGPIPIVADPKDTYREDSLSRLDLRAEKAFTFGRRATKVSVLFDVFNTFNAAAITNRNEATLPAGGFRRPLSVQPPRTARLGARIRF